MATSSQQLIERAKELAAEKKLSYTGALNPKEAWELLNADDNAVLVDVRTDAELDWVGQVSFSEDRSLHVEWNNYPDGIRNADFIAQIADRVEKHQPVLHQRSSVNGWRFHGLPWEQH